MAKGSLRSPKKSEARRVRTDMAVAAAASTSRSVPDAIKPGALLKSLLDDPVRYVGSSRDELKASMSLEAARASHFEVVNETTTADNNEADIPPPTAKDAAASSLPLYTPRIVPQFPRAHMRAAGLHNRGNTCYMNSVMQALLHTPPLAHAMLTQSVPTLLGRYGMPRTKKQALKAANAFNAVAALKEFFERAYSGASAVTPSQFIANLRKFARPLRPGRQEDAHEYLRLLLESMQHACTCFARKSVAPNDPVLMTTLIQKIFGGRLRSRVTCHSCRHNSDTFDPVLDLSLDVRKGIASVKQALDAFTAPEMLSDKYRCDHCHRHVDATKRFTIDATPLALTVHLKRFTIFGNKINKTVSYGERLHLGRYMSERQKGLGADQTMDEESLSTIGAAQQYRLYAVVHHYGSGPNVGHYVASVRSSDGTWLRMDDSYVSPLSHCPLDDPSAYLLLYVREPVALDATTTTPMASPRKGPMHPPPSPKKRKVAPLRRDRPEELSAEEDEGLGQPLSRAEYQHSRTSGDSSDEASIDQELTLPPPLSKKDVRRRKRRKLARRSLA
ncbi:cysteine-type deubiquitinase [Malassezia pachydermatis]|uniref:Ubiquitin carboxyl-terminal hydrolase n=1 Tax=Malassezia pachydermatis TaxID=77020 RepID=A0A0M9VQA3_9BASI|nr:cysteine proteinase [Malassezia pachydermatis]KOS15319.1 cysteine proteinase [Malassezia pachydermatis]